MLGLANGHVPSAHLERHKTRWYLHLENSPVQRVGLRWLMGLSSVCKDLVFREF